MLCMPVVLPHRAEGSCGRSFPFQILQCHYVGQVWASLGCSKKEISTACEIQRLKYELLFLLQAKSQPPIGRQSEGKSDSTPSTTSTSSGSPRTSAGGEKEKEKEGKEEGTPKGTSKGISKGTPKGEKPEKGAQCS